MRLLSVTPAAEITHTTATFGHVVPVGVARAIRFMRDNLAANTSIHAIAAAAGRSEPSLRRQFRRFTGESPVAFHRNLRFDAARRTLQLHEKTADVTTV